MDSSGGSAGRWASEGLGMFSKICLSRLSQGTVRCGGGLGASKREVAGAEASVMGMVCSRCVAPWHGQGAVAIHSEHCPGARQSFEHRSRAQWERP